MKRPIQLKIFSNVNFVKILGEVRVTLELLHPSLQFLLHFRLKDIDLILMQTTVNNDDYEEQSFCNQCSKEGLGNIFGMVCASLLSELTKMNTLLICASCETKLFLKAYKLGFPIILKQVIETIRILLI